jgi:hypothetical protein
VPSGAGKRTAYALLVLGNDGAGRQVLIHDVIGFGRGETPARRVHLLQVLDSSHRVIFELVAGSDRHLYLTSPAGGLRATPLVLATGAVVPNDGISGVAVDVALKTNRWVLVSVNGMRTAAVHRLAGARTGAPRFLAAGVIGYKAPAHAGAITAIHAQVSFSTSAAPAATVAAPPGQPPPAAQPAQPAAPPLSWLAPPTISGHGVVGDTLAATSGSWSDPTATFTYAWERCDGNGSCAPIDGAENRTYDLVAADRDAFVRVRVTAHVGDASVSKASAVIGPVTPAAPTELGEPRIFGDAVIGSPLTADPGSWSDRDANFTFVWQRCDDNEICRTIYGATGATYIPTADDLGSFLRVEVTASNGGGENTAHSAPTNVVVPAAPTLVTGPTMSGDATVGSTLTADPGTWSDPAATFTYVWLRCHGSGNCTTIDGAADTTYELTRDDVGFRIEVTVTAANVGGTGSATSNLVGPVVPHAPPAAVTAPSLRGDASVGSTLTADPGTWSDPTVTFTYAWLRCDAGSASGACTTIGGDATTYTLTADDLGFSIGVEVIATGVTGRGTADSSLLGPVVPQAPPAVVTAPSLSGDAIVGSTLTADPGTWSDPSATFTYAWLRCDASGASGACTTIGGPDGTTYTLTADDLGSSIGVLVTATGVTGTGTAASGLLGPVVLQAPPAVVTPPAVSGDAIVGSTLTADPGTWSDPTATFTYAWLRCHSNKSGSCRTIVGADGTTYTLASEDLDFLMRVEVTAANAGGTAMALSPPTGLVEPAAQTSFTADARPPGSR